MDLPSQKVSRFRLPGHSSELQGVRALAVCAVLFYHIDESMLPGGFLGVDIFFVLSGFLIGRKLLVELDETGTIALKKFFAGRARRLLPNSIIVLFCTAIAAFLLLPAYRLPDIAADIRSAVLIYSNIHFAGNAIDYLRMDEPPSPVLHFWSLSIEEQFYIGLPLVMCLIAAISNKHRIALSLVLFSALMLISFAVGAYTLQTSKPEAFFLTHNRIWQLAVGVLAGWLASKRPTLPQAASYALLIISLCVMLGSIATITSRVPYPGLLSLLPTLSTAVFLVSLELSQGTLIHRTLAAPVSQWIGDRSYSIYLWHWPFIVIAAEAFQGVSGINWMSGSIAVVVAAIVYQFIEDPLRKKKPRNLVRIAAFAGSGIATIAAMTVVMPLIDKQGDNPERDARIMAAKADLGGAFDSKCIRDFWTSSATGCTYGAPDNNKSIMLFGDSHAAQWFDPLRAAAENTGWTFIAHTKMACPSPLISIWFPGTLSIYENCATWRSRVLVEIKRKPPAIIVLANYSGYSGWIASDGKPVSDRRAINLWRAGLLELLKELPEQSEIWLIRDNPNMFRTFLACLSYSDDCKRPREEAMGRLVEDADIVQLAERPVKVLDFTDQFCDSSNCPALIDGIIAYRDTHHITASFAKTLTGEFERQLQAQVVR